jgi:hypothetical protein
MFRADIVIVHCAFSTNTHVSTTLHNLFPTIGDCVIATFIYRAPEDGEIEISGYKTQVCYISCHGSEDHRLWWQELHCPLNPFTDSSTLTTLRGCNRMFFPPITFKRVSQIR